MVNLGLYGTLLDPDIRALVFGEASRTAGRPATLTGWARFYVEGEKYPGIRRRDGSVIDVLVLEGLAAETLAVADSFEGDGYSRETLDVQFTDTAGGNGSAMFYVPKPVIALSAQEWRYDETWRALHAEAFLQEARAAVAGNRTVVRR